MDCKSVHGISRQEHWSELLFPHFLLQEDLPDPGLKPESPASADGFSTAEPQGSKLAGPVSLQAGSQCFLIEATASLTNNKLTGSESHPGPPGPFEKGH